MKIDGAGMLWVHCTRCWLDTHGERAENQEMDRLRERVVTDKANLTTALAAELAVRQSSADAARHLAASKAEVKSAQHAVADLEARGFAWRLRRPARAEPPRSPNQTPRAGFTSNQTRPGGTAKEGAPRSPRTMAEELSRARLHLAAAEMAHSPQVKAASGLRVRTARARQQIEVQRRQLMNDKEALFRAEHAVEKMAHQMETEMEDMAAERVQAVMRGKLVRRRLAAGGAALRTSGILCEHEF